MYRLIYKGGYFHVLSDGDDNLKRFDWLTPAPNNDDYFYFIPNKTTRECFRRDMMHDPDWDKANSKGMEILRDIDLTGYYGEWTKPIAVPQGITLEDYQLECVVRMLEHKNYGFFFGTGTGKTLMAITYLCTMQPESVLILTPKKVIGQYIENLNKFMNYRPRNLEVVNYEQLLSKSVHFAMTRYDVIIVDESHRLKDYMSKTNEFIRKRMHFEHMYLFTGSPQDKSRYDILSQLALFDFRFMPTKSKTMQRYFVLDEYYKPTTEKLYGELTEMINSVTYGRTTDDVLNLPPENHVIITTKRPPLYDKLKQDKMFIIENDDDKQSFRCICDTPAKLANKLNQVANGFLQDDGEGKLQKTLVLEENGKIEELDKLIATLKQAIIYTGYKKDIELVSKLMDERGYTYVTVDGSVGLRQSDEAIAKFKSSEARFLIIQYNSGKEGLDLMNTNNTIFFTMPTSYITYSQCLGRTRRRGQTADVCNYYYLLGIGTVQRHIYRTVAIQKKSFNARLYKQYEV